MKMVVPRRAIPERLLRDFVPVDGSLLVSRYNAALESVGAPATELASFRIDAGGYSPEVAAELGDPLYLGRDALHAHAILISAAQLGAPLVHPSLGFAADAYRRVVSRAKQEISAITLREPVVAEAHHGSARLTLDRQLADPTRFELCFRTPGGLLRSSRRLEEMKREFLASDRLWLDDEFIHDMAELARQVRDLGPIPEDFAASRHSLGPFYTPAFGGSYVVEEKGRRASTTTILSGQREVGEAAPRESLRERRVALEPLSADCVVRLLLHHQVARFDHRSLRGQPDVLAGIQHWVAIDHLLSRDPERRLAKRDPGEVERAMRGEQDPPPDYLELADIRRRLSDGRRITLDSLSAITQLRLLTPSSTRPAIRAFVRHIRAAVDEVNLEWAWRDAADLFFARLPGLSDPHCGYFARWLDARPER